MLAKRWPVASAGIVSCVIEYFYAKLKVFGSKGLTP